MFFEKGIEKNDVKVLLSSKMFGAKRFSLKSGEWSPVEDADRIGIKCKGQTVYCRSPKTIKGGGVYKAFDADGDYKIVLTVC